jgi:hypothetical protein
MKQTLIILAIITATIQTFAQSPRIKLNQITKDSVTGSVLISSPTDSGMVYSRDLFISYGADTFLILGGDTLAATSSIISSVLSDGVTITGDGTTGSELTVDTTTYIATKGDLTGYVDLSTTQNVGGAKTFTNNFTTNGGSVKLGTNNWPTNDYGEGNGRILVNATNIPLLVWKQNTVANNPAFVQLGQTKEGINGTEQIRGGAIAGGYEGVGNNGYLSLFTTPSSNLLTERVRINAAGNVGIGTTSPSEKLEVNGKVKISDLTGTGGNAVYENGGVLGVASDGRFKSHIADLDNGIEKILNLKPKYFIDNRNSAFQQLGFYAQEVKSVINEASYPIGNTDYLGINDRAIIAVTVKAIQEQQAIIESIQTELNVKSSIIESQATEIEQLKTLITELNNRLTILENN